MSTEAYPCPQCGNMRGIGSWPFCPDHGIPHGGISISAIHTSERATVFRNPRTGEVRYPPVSNAPMHPKYAAQGYVREELATAQQVREFERSTGRLHERSWYDPGSGAAERATDVREPEPIKRDPELTRRLVQAIS